VLNEPTSDQKVIFRTSPLASCQPLNAPTHQRPTSPTRSHPTSSKPRSPRLHRMAIASGVARAARTFVVGPLIRRRPLLRLNRSGSELQQTCEHRVDSRRMYGLMGQVGRLGRVSVEVIQDEPAPLGELRVCRLGALWCGQRASDVSATHTTDREAPRQQLEVTDADRRFRRARLTGVAYCKRPNTRGCSRSRQMGIHSRQTGIHRGGISQPGISQPPCTARHHSQPGTIAAGGPSAFGAR
jgi:hypothetical protein